MFIPILSVFLVGLLVVSVPIESSQGLARAQNCTKNTLPNSNPAGEVSSIHQSQSMKPKSIPGSRSNSHELVRKKENTRWRVYTHKSRHFGYRVEYPSDWSVEESENVSFFKPPAAKTKSESIAVVVINYKKTPPLPVHHTYETIRTVKVDAEEIPVRKRQPSPVTEKYFAERKKGGYVAELRFHLDRQHDAVFDRMLSTLTFIE